MQRYELMVIFSPQLMSEGGNTPKSSLEKFFKKIKATVVEEDDWGEKALEYTIEGYDRGYYVVYILEMAPEVADELTTKIKLEKGLLRWLLTKQEVEPNE